MLVWQLPQGAAMSPPMTFVLVSGAYSSSRKMGQRRLLQFLGERKLAVLTRGEKKVRLAVLTYDFIVALC